MPEQQLRIQTGSSEWAGCSGGWVQRTWVSYEPRTGTLEGHGPHGGLAAGGWSEWPLRADRSAYM